MFVTNTLVIRSRANFLKACGNMIANRTGAVYATDTLTAQALSRDAAYVVREGMYQRYHPRTAPPNANTSS